MTPLPPVVSQFTILFGGGAVLIVLGLILINGRSSRPREVVWGYSSLFGGLGCLGVGLLLGVIFLFVIATGGPT